MAREPSPYRKLTGVHRALGAMTQLWAGPDHLLHVNSTGYTENYRRLYFRDIQVMLVVHTARRLFLNLTLAVLYLLFGLMFMWAGWVGWVIVAAAFTPLLVWNFLLGPGCRVVVVTAVAQENIRALSRLPKTRRVLADLEPLIQAAQAGLAEPAAESAAAAPETAPPLPGPDTPPTLPPFPVV